MLYVDYQNTYGSAREVYHDETDPHWCGQFHPGTVGRLIVDRSPYDRVLSGVRIYRGLPSGAKDPKGYSAARAQMGAWSRDGDVDVIARPLRYPVDWPRSKPREKGVDVALAVDFVMGAVKGWFDVGVIMSRDTDLRPALETVLDELHGVRVEVSAWNRRGVECGRLSLPSRKIWCHWLDEHDYTAVADDHDYNRGAP